MKKIIIVLLFLPAIIFSQELDATVTINYEQLQTAYKEKLSGFRNQIETYLNTTQFSGRPWEWQPIKCSFNIFFTSASSETQYSAQVVISSQRPLEGLEQSSLMLSIMDNSWSFRYEKNQPLYFNQTDFDPLTSFLDFYAYLIIGWDSDSYDYSAGSDFYREALKIAVLGCNSQYSDAWIMKTTSYNKRAIIEELLEANFQQFRQDFTDYHFNGLDLFYQNKMKTFESIKKLIVNLEALRIKLNRRSVLLNVFFEAKAGEIINYLKQFEDRSLFDVLKRVDPARISKYIEASEG